MGRARRLSAGTRDCGLAIEYVRTRRVVRLLGWLHDEAIEPVEIPIHELCERLGIDGRDVGAPLHYLLFAGSQQRPAGGLRDLVGMFDAADEAWAAFRDLRQADPTAQGWAELAAMNGAGQLIQLAWFGMHRGTGPDEETQGAGEATKEEGERPLVLASADVPPGLQAVTPS